MGIRAVACQSADCAQVRDLAGGDDGRQGMGLGPFLFHPCTHPNQLPETCSDGDTHCSDRCCSCFLFFFFVLVLLLVLLVVHVVIFVDFVVVV